MAKITAGLFSTPQGKISRDLWYNPRNGSLYSPTPSHKDARSAKQLFHRSKMKALAPIVRWFAKNVSKPVWGMRIKYFTPYNFAMGLSMLLYWPESVIPDIRVLMSYDRWWAPYYVGGTGVGWQMGFFVRPLAASLVGKDVRMCFTLYTAQPLAFHTTGWIPYASGWLPGFYYDYRWPTGQVGVHFIAVYREATGLFLYVGESVSTYMLPAVANF